jgi:hypothetical protein
MGDRLHRHDPVEILKPNPREDQVPIGFATIMGEKSLLTRETPFATRFGCGDCNHRYYCRRNVVIGMIPSTGREIVPDSGIQSWTWAAMDDRQRRHRPIQPILQKNWLSTSSTRSARGSQEAPSRGRAARSPPSCMRRVRYATKKGKMSRLSSANS